MIDVDDRCRALTSRGWEVSVESRYVARTVSNFVVFRTYVAEARRDGECLREEKSTPGEAIEFLFWKVARVDEGIETGLETL